MTNIKNHILLVDDDKALSDLLSEYLARENFTIQAAYDGQAAIDTVQDSHQFCVIVLDIMMPKLNGLEVLQILRQKINTPVIMLTGRGDEIDRIIGLEMGADDYLAKPCNPRELLARIHALLRRSRPQSNSTEDTPQFISLNNLTLQISKRQLFYKETQVELTGAEFNILSLLMQSAGSPLSKQELTRQVLHRDMTPYDRSIDVHVSRLRKKLEDISDKDDNLTYIKTIRGEGYQFIY